MPEMCIAGNFLERRDFLLGAIFVNAEILLLQTRDVLTRFIGDHYRHQHHLRMRTKRNISGLLIPVLGLGKNK